VALRSYKNLQLRAISVGSATSLPPSLIESCHLSSLISELRETFDLIVLDTPPVLAVSDPLFVSRLADATVLVVAWKATPQNLVTEAIHELHKTQAPLTGLLLNKVDTRQTASYRHSYYSDNRYAPAV
jgi:Mrp family chromosome partitioning ATPase